jgi:hypothetical protein
MEKDSECLNGKIINVSSAKSAITVELELDISDRFDEKTQRFSRKKRTSFLPDSVYSLDGKHLSELDLLGMVNHRVRICKRTVYSIQELD